MIEEFVNYIIKFRKTILFLSITFVFSLLVSMPKINVDTDFEIYFEKDDPDLISYQAITKEFPREANIVFLITDAEAKEAPSGRTFVAAKQLTDFAKSDPIIETVSSIYTYEEIKADANEINSIKVLEGLITDKEAKLLTKRLNNDPNVAQRLISKNAKMLSVYARLYEKPKGARPLVEITQKYRSLARSIEQKFPGLTILVTGLVPLEATLFEVMLQDGKLLIPIVFFIILLSLYILLKSVLGVFITLIVSFTATISAFSLMPRLDMSLNDITISAALVIVTIATSDCIHVLTNVFQNDDPTIGRLARIKEGVKRCIVPIFMTTITTIVGFLFFIFSVSPPIKEFGVISAIGVGFAFLYTLFILIPLIIIFPIRQANLPLVHSRVSSVLLKLNVVVASKGGMLIVSTVCIYIGLFAFMNTLDDDIVEYLDTSTEVRKAVNLAEGELTGLQFIDIVFDTNTPDGINDPEVISIAEQVTKWLQKHAVFTTSDSLVTHLSNINNKLNVAETNISLPKTSEGISELLFMLEILMPEDALGGLINDNRSQTKIRAFLPALSSAEIIMLDQEIRTFLGELSIPSNLKVITTSPTLMFAYLGEKNLISVFFSSVIFLFVVIIFITLFLRSFRYGLISILPNLMPILIVFGIWAVFVGKLNLASVAVVTAIFGLIVDDTIHVMWHYIQKKRNGLSHHQSLTQVYTYLSPALFTTSVSFALGFSVLMLSSFEPNWNMGALVALSVIVAYLFDLIILPQFLKRIIL